MPGVADGTAVGPDGLGVIKGVGSAAEFNVGVGFDGPGFVAGSMARVGSGARVLVGSGTAGSSEHPENKRTATAVPNKISLVMSPLPLHPPSIFSPRS